ncbi:hypothetical protein [Spirosoma flavum]|uniref:Uncharacterized protein n=1 Tax=Spirosoma flavum TaxID=2048557 RepID=A0ABW6AGZ0_9BACT
MYEKLVSQNRPGMSVLKVRLIQYTVVCLLIFLGLLSACQQETKTKTSTIPLDTTIVDDDTLEVDDGPKFKQTEHAR